MHHIESNNWLKTTTGDPRGYIQPESLKELWFYTCSACNLQCPFCLEGSKPGDKRIDLLKFEDAKPFIDEGLTLGVKQFSFTGGEPFICKDIVKILDYALDYRPCLVLTNGTDPLRNRIDELKPLLKKANSLKLRISIDHPNQEEHDQGRGEGVFQTATSTLAELHRLGFDVSIARLRTGDDTSIDSDSKYFPLLEKIGLPTSINIVSFPDLDTPFAKPELPQITENCMTTYKDESTRAQFMCNYSKMVLKIDGKMAVYACTLVTDDSDYDLGSTLTDAMNVRVMMRHHRCYSCFSAGTSCSEL